MAKGRIDASEYAISVARRDEIPELLALQQDNLAINGGALSVAFPASWFEQSIQEMPVLVARRDGRLVGYLASSLRARTRHLALSEAKYSAYSAAPDAYNSGPLCIAGSERGRGLAGLLLGALIARLPGREAAAFIRCDNPASRAVHRKAGFREVAMFSHAGVKYVVAVHSV